MSAVDCTGVTKAFDGVAALRGADLVMAEGSLTAVLGPSGCGKTTLLRVVAGFERLDAGRVSVGGRVVAEPGRHLPPERRGVAIVPQEQALFPHLTVAGNIGYGLPRGPARRRRTDEMLEMAGLTGLAERMPHELSGGQQQRVALARALAPGPAVVLLDEPFGSLDATLRSELRAEVAALLRATGATALLVTHDQEEGLSVADTVAVMRDGVIVQQGPPHLVYAVPADPWVASFVGSANVLPGTVAGPALVDCALGRLEAVWGPTGPVAAGSVSVVVRPEQLGLAAGGGAAGMVEERSFFGHDALVTVALAGGSHVVARLRSVGPVSVGQTTSVTCTGPVLCFPGPGPPVPEAGHRAGRA